MRNIEETSKRVSELGIKNARLLGDIARRTAASGVIVVYDFASDYLTRRMNMSDIDWNDSKAVLQEIQAVLYGGDEDKEWTPDTIEDIAYLVNRWAEAQSGS